MPEPLDDVRALAAALEGPLLLRWMKSAQRLALLDYRDRTEYPGVRARFDARNPYVFNYRLQGKRRQLPPYRHTGAMMQELVNRAPKSRVVGDAVVSSLSIRPRVLPFLNRYKSVFSIISTRESVTYPLRVYKDSVGRTGQYTMQVTRMARRKHIKFTDQTYAQEWAVRPDEIAWVANAVDVRLAAMLRSRIQRAGPGRIALPPEAA